LSNAIKYNRPNGTVMLRSEVAEEKEIALYIQDTGLGIPDESLPHLFQKFYRVREHESRVAGTGLGLSICKQIINGHGGRIEVKSKIGVGTVFSVFLPYSGKVHPPVETIDGPKK
jgi:two-component system, OmpR family, phosphate regulon sensor histidine kinase PhoR